MELTPMRYKTYTWPYNPKTYSIHYERKMAVHKIPFGRYALEDLGLTRRVMEGEGEFTGEGAYEEFKKLASVFYQSGPGALSHPVWQSAKAYFVNLELTQEPKKDYVRYAFTFWEDYDGDSAQLTAVTASPSTAAVSTGTTASAAETTTTAAAQYHRATQGETLWSIAADWGLSAGEILVLNTQLKNPNNVTVGTLVRVR
jgi:prophage DNA circulation protein